MQMITNRNEAKTLANANLKIRLRIQIKNAIKKHVNVSVKFITRVKKDYNQNPSTCICENGKYLKSVVDDSKTLCDEVIYVMDIVSTKMTDTIATNVASTVSINCHSKKVRYKTDFYIFL